MNRAFIILSPLLVLASYWLALVTAGDGRPIAATTKTESGFVVHRGLALLSMPRQTTFTPPRRRAPRPSNEARCENAFDSAKRLEPSRLDIFGATNLYSDLRGCRRHPELQSRLRAVEFACRRFIDEELSPECRQSFFNLRAAAIAFADGESDPDKIADAEVLTHRLFLLESFAENSGDWQWREKMSLSERLLEVQPDNATAAEFLLSGIQGLIGEDPRVADNEETWKKAQRAVRVLDPSSDKRVEWELFLESEGLKPTLLEQAARDVMSEYPQSGLPYYWLAYANARERDEEGEEEALAEAYRREPNNRRVQAAWEEMQLSRSPSFTFGNTPSAKELILH